MAEILFFPMNRWASKVRRVAEVLDAKFTHRSREAYWLDTTKTLTGMLVRRGADHATVTAQLARFEQAVWAEMARRAS